MESYIDELRQKVELYEYILYNTKALIYVNSPDTVKWINVKQNDIIHNGDEINAMGHDVYREKYYHKDDIKIFEESYKYLCDKNIGFATSIYRLKDKKDNWRQFLGTSVVSKWTENGLPEESVNCAIDISEKFAEFTKLESILKENAYLKNKLLLKDLTKRECEIIKHIAEGLSSKQIAEKIHISHQTVDVHRKNIFRKLKLNNMADLARFATECGL